MSSSGERQGGWPVAGAAAATIGAWIAQPLPWWVPVGAAALVLVRRHPIAWCLLLLVATDVLAARAIDGLDPPAEGAFEGTVRLVTDPEPVTGARLRFEAATPQGRLLVEVRSPTAIEAIDTALAGDLLRVRGVSGPLTRSTSWTRSRHLAGALRIEAVQAHEPGRAHHAVANAYRRVLERGASTLDPTQRSLLSGLVLGDDRAQPPQLTADFRASGLTHLLAVSGQNVAFVLVVVGPLLHSLRLWPRFVVSVSVIGAFAVVTRFEPSVLRAAFVAVVALYAHTTGRPSGGVRHLAIAVCGLLVVDPLLVHSLGFRLSVAASVGVLALAPVIAARLRGPRWIRDGLSVTAGAQCAVAPVLIPTLGPMPLAALPANLLAGPIAGALMVWGLTAGTVAGIVGGRAAWALHRPSAFGLDLLDRIAGAGASLPLGSLDLRHVALLVVAAVAAARGSPSLRIIGVVLIAVALVAPVLTPQPRGARSAGWAATVWVDGPVAVVDLRSGADAADVIEVLRDGHIRAVGLVVVRSSKQTMVPVIESIEARFPVGAVIGPERLRDPDVVVVPGGFRARVGRLEVVVDRVGPPMRVRIGWGGLAGVAGPSAEVGSPGAPGAGRP